MFDSLLNDQALIRLRELSETSPPGAFVEVGVYRGGSAAVLYAVAMEQGRQLYLYDTFAGHPTPHPEDDAANHPAGRFADGCDPLTLSRLLKHAVVCAGPFPKTLRPMGRVAFVHADADLYEPTKAICDLMPNLMVPGGRILFDDYGATECPGCTRAVDDSFGPATGLGRLIEIHQPRKAG